jgi:hypothetical protein
MQVESIFMLASSGLIHVRSEKTKMSWMKARTIHPENIDNSHASLKLHPCSFSHQSPSLLYPYLILDTDAFLTAGRCIHPWSHRLLVSCQFRASGREFVSLLDLPHSLNLPIINIYRMPWSCLWPAKNIPVEPTFSGAPTTLHKDQKPFLASKNHPLAVQPSSVH